MKKRHPPEEPVSQNEICACAHIADRLLNLGERQLAIGVIEAIYCLISYRDGTGIHYHPPTRKPELTLIINGKT